MHSAEYGAYYMQQDSQTPDHIMRQNRHLARATVTTAPFVVSYDYKMTEDMRS